jgi:hypothetical protein
MALPTTTIDGRFYWPPGYRELTRTSRGLEAQARYNR